MNNLIFVPFAYIKGANFGSNIKSKSKVLNIYLENAFVALKTSKLNNPNSTVALITNLDFRTKYKKLFFDNGIEILKFEFDSFRFRNKYHYCLAFYKLCAIKHVSTLNFDNFIMLDADIVCKGSLDSIYKEINNNLLVYQRINSTLPVIDSLLTINKQGYTNERRIKRIGGEFLASNRNNIQNFIYYAQIVYLKMIKEAIENQFGDEFITSTAITLMENVNYNGGRYICRCETGWFREIPKLSVLDATPLLHFPAEKNDGMRKVYKYIIKNDRLPNIKKLYKMLHINNMSVYNKIKRIIKFYLRIK